MRIHPLLFLIIILLNGCASALGRKKQTVVIHTGYAEARVFVNNQFAGTGETVSTSLKKDFEAKQIKVVAPGYMPVYYAAIQSKKSPLYALSFIPAAIVIGIPISNSVNNKEGNGTALLIMPGAVGFIFADVFWRGYRYKKNIYSPLLYKEGLRAPDQKSISTYDLTFKGGSENISYYRMKYKRFSEHFNDEIVKQKQRTKYDAELDAWSNAMKKEDDVYFHTNELSNILRSKNFIDTTIFFLDYDRSFSISSVINTVDYFNIYRPHGLLTPFPNNFIYASSNITWEIKTKYGEILGTKTVISTSGKFSPDYYTERSDSMPGKLANSILSNSFAELMNDSSISTLLSIKKDSIHKPRQILNLKSPIPTGSAKEASNACVIIKTKNKFGSGFAISNDGYILTNYHIIAPEYIGQKNTISVKTINGEYVNAELIRYNKQMDLALIKVNKIFDQCFELPLLKNYQPGTEAFTFGISILSGLSPGLSKGIVSGEIENGTYLIQLNMSLSNGNNGGAIFSKDGKQLIGVVNIALINSDNEGTGFCIPAFKIAEYLNLSYDTKQ